MEMRCGWTGVRESRKGERGRGKQKGNQLVCIHKHTVDNKGTLAHWHIAWHSHLGRDAPGAPSTVSNKAKNNTECSSFVCRWLCIGLCRVPFRLTKLAIVRWRAQSGSSGHGNVSSLASCRLSANRTQLKSYCQDVWSCCVACGTGYARPWPGPSGDQFRLPEQ